MQAHDLHLTAQDVEDHRIVPILHDDALVAKLLEELPVYLLLQLMLPLTLTPPDYNGGGGELVF